MKTLRANPRMILGTAFDLIDYEEVAGVLEASRQRGERVYFTLTNPHSVLMARRDGRFREATEKARLTLPDGVGVIFGAWLLGYPQRGRVTGPTLMLKLCDWGRQHGYRHYFCGGDEGIAERLAARLVEKFPGMKVAGCFCPPFRDLTEAEEGAMVERINATEPDIVWVGLGAPKQEKWMLGYHGRIAATAMIGVGAAFDFHSGNLPWTPKWIRAIGMEWLFRLCCEPRRMWRRNLDSPIFLCRVVAQRIRRTGG